jgi:hypothetical protein
MFHGWFGSMKNVFGLLHIKVLIPWQIHMRDTYRNTKDIYIDTFDPDQRDITKKKQKTPGNICLTRYDRRVWFDLSLSVRPVLS